MPPEDRDKMPSWTSEVDESAKEVIRKHGGMPGPFDWVFFTSIPIWGAGRTGSTEALSTGCLNPGGGTRGDCEGCSTVRKHP
jgi:hypothetical protein